MYNACDAYKKVQTDIKFGIYEAINVSELVPFTIIELNGTHHHLMELSF